MFFSIVVVILIQILLPSLWIIYDRALFWGQFSAIC